MEPRSRNSAGKGQDRLAPNSMKALPETKLRAFEQGTVAVNSRTNPSRRTRDDPRAKLEEEQVLKEFIAAFEEPTSKTTKTFIKGGVFNPGSHEETPIDRGKSYRGSTKSSESSQDHAHSQSSKTHTMNLSSSTEQKPKFKNEREKRKSNLETFKEELKRMQEERERRHAQKHRDKEDAESSHHESRHASEDPNTTNLFINTIPRAMNEASIMELFGRYGPLASVKIMYPRTEEEKSRGTNCGFVAYMSRKDAERAMHELNGTQLESISIRMSWGRSVHIPPQPVYIPPSLRELILPPPPSGLPFNAQPNAKHRTNKPSDGIAKEKELLEHATVRVTIPQDRALLCLIHRMIEFVIREGPLFEAAIMSREINNPQFRFLFDNQCPAHTYYRWKLYSILQGDSITTWRTEAFRLFRGGSLWLPPQPQQFTSGMPDEFFDKTKKENDHDHQSKGESSASVNSSSNNNSKRGRLSQRQRDQLDELLASLTPERNRIGDAMIWAIDHAEAADEIIDSIVESLAVEEAPPYKKISRLYLISDILHNCSVRVTNASYYRRGFEMRLPEVFQYIHQSWSSIEGRLRAEQFKQKVMNSFRAWESWAIYPSDFLIKLQNIFLGLVRFKSNGDSDKKKSNSDEDIDGKPIDSSENRSLALVADYDDEEDIDGKPIAPAKPSIDDDIDGRPIGAPAESRARVQEPAKKPPPPPPPPSSSAAKPRFVPTKWESVDPNQVAAQAVTLSKWDFDQDSTIKPTDSLYEDFASSNSSVETSNPSQENSMTDEKLRKSSATSAASSDTLLAHESSAAHEMSEERRQKLRDIEIQVLKYSDDLESGRRERVHGLSLAEEIQFYRQSLLKKIDEEEKRSVSNSSPDSSRSSYSHRPSSTELHHSSRYSQQRSSDEKNQEVSSRRDDSSSRHRSTSSRTNPTDSTHSSSSSSRSTSDHHHHPSKRKREERSPSPRHSRTNRR